MSQTPDISDVIDDAVEGGLESVYTSLPGEITNYNSSKQSADVLPLITVGEEGENGEIEWRPIPVIPNLPVVFPGAGTGGNAYRMTWPLNKGDTVLIIFANYDTGSWRTKGGKIQVPPGRGRVKDAFILAGLHDFGHAPTTPPSDAMVMTVPTGKNLRLGGTGAVNSIVLQFSLDGFIIALAAAIAQLTSSSDPAVSALVALQTHLGTPFPTGGGWPIPTGSWPATHMTAKTRAE